MGDYDPEACNTRLQLGLGLGLGLGGYTHPRQEMKNKDRPLVCLDLSFALRPKPEDLDHHMTNGSSLKRNIIDEDEEDRRSPDYAASEITTSKNGARKKLRLTKEQTTLLEDSFKSHSTLNPTQKHALAARLNLKPRQVEVWFQNRRARTKLKQTEVDCEFLKKWCESLSDENQKLKKELQELKSLSMNGASPLVTHQIPKTTMLTMCSSCERKAKGNDQYPNNAAAAKN